MYLLAVKHEPAVGRTEGLALERSPFEYHLPYG